MAKRYTTKLADDVGFEKNFFQIAFAYVRDKIPNLLDYMLGFEVVNKNEEGTQAIGLFKFDIGGRVLYVPVFYKNGELKGAELLYNYNQDRFVPNKENWVDSLLNARPEELGEPSAMRKGDPAMGLGQGGDLSKLYNPTMGTKLGMTKMAHLSADIGWTLPEFLKQADCSFAETYTKTLMQYPELHKLATEAYGDELYEALKSCKEAKVTQLDNEKVPDVEIIDVNSPEATLDFLSDKDKKELIEEGVVIKDNRKDKDGPRIAYKIETPMVLNGSNGPGAYDVLLKGGRFVKAVLTSSLNGQRDNRQLFIPTEGKGNPAEVEASMVFAATLDQSAETFKKFLAGLDDVSSVRGNSNSQYSFDKAVPHYVFIEADGSQGSGPYTLEPALEYEGTRTFNTSGCTVTKVVISAAYRRMKIVDNTLYVPDAAKAMKFSAKKYCCNRPDLGDARDIDAKIRGLFDEVKVSKDRAGFQVLVNGRVTLKEATKRDTYVGLVAGIGMSIVDAKTAIVKAATTLEPAIYTFQKRAAPFFSPGQVATPEMPPLPMGMNSQLGVPEQYPQAVTMSAASGEPGNVLNQRIMDGIGGMGQQPPALNQQSVDSIMQSAQAGERNVFDVANISELINRADIDAPLEKYLVDLNTSLDRLGRIYFLMLFHGDKFAERYSQEDLPSMEESVRTTFLTLGELILKLKERKIQADSGSAVETDLNQLV